MKRAKLLWITALLVVLLGAALIWRYRVVDEQRHDAERAAAQRQLETQITAMVSRWNAIDNWQGFIKPGLLPSQLYTADFEKAMLGERPILLYATIDDIGAAKGGFQIEMSSPITQWPAKLQYRFGANADVAKKLLADRHSYFRIFAVIAHIDRVEKRTRIVTQEVNGAKDTLDEEYFLAEGTALDAFLLGVTGLSLARIPNDRN